MEEFNDNNYNKIKKFKLRQSNNNFQIIYLIIMMIVILSSMPSYVKCDLTDTISSVILFFIFTLFTCAGIGWWSRRGDPKY